MYEPILINLLHVGPQQAFRNVSAVNSGRGNGLIICDFDRIYIFKGQDSQCTYIANDSGDMYIRVFGKIVKKYLGVVSFLFIINLRIEADCFWTTSVFIAYAWLAPWVPL